MFLDAELMLGNYTHLHLPRKHDSFITCMRMFIFQTMIVCYQLGINARTHLFRLHD